MIKLIATDLDGTLLYPKRKITVLTTKNKNFLKNYISKGNKVVIVSGRNIAISKDISDVVGSQIDMIACNGSVVLKDGEIIYDSPMNHDDIRTLYEENKNNPNILSWVVMAKDHPMVIVPVGINPILTLFYKIGLFFQFKYLEKYVIGEEHLYKLLDDENSRIYKIMPLFGLGEQAIIKARDNIPHFIDAYGTKFEILWSAEAIEFMNKGVNKAKALKDYIKLMNLEPSEVAVVGDSGNDVPLFEEFENSFVMKNAPEEVRKTAKTEIEGVFSLEEHIY